MTLAALALLAQIVAVTPRPAGGTGTVIVPDRFLRKWDPVTIFFDRDLGTMGPEDHSDRVAKISPAQPGAFTWLDRRTLQFRPAEPWPPLARFTWTAGGKRVSLSTLMEAPADMLPHAGASGLEKLDEITLTFPEPLDRPASLARMVSIELRPLPGIDAGAGQRVDAREYDVKARERHARGELAAYSITFRRPLPSGKRVIVRLRLSLDDAATEAFWEGSFSTAEPFRVVRVGTPRNGYPIAPEGSRYASDQAIDGGNEARVVTVEFSTPPRALGPVEARNLVRFTPPVADLSFQTHDRTLEIAGKFAADTLYRVRIVPTPIADRNGRPLEMSGESEIPISFSGRPDYLRLRAGQGIAEREGPRMLPLEGRGDERVDLRIHAVDPLDRSYWPFPDRPVTVDESARPPGPGEEAAPFTDPRPITESELRAQILRLGSPVVSRLVDLPLKRNAPSASFGIDLAEELAFASGRRKPGTYLVGIRRLGASSDRAWMRVQVTDLSLTTLEEPEAVRFQVTSLASGRPVPGARVSIEGSVTENGEKPVWKTLGEGTTDAEGAFRWTAPGASVAERAVSVGRLVVRKDDDVLVLDPRKAPDGYADNQWSPTRARWLQWTEEPLDHRRPQPKTLCHIFTERPVYRPEEPVHIKGYVRRRERGVLAIETFEAFVVVEGPGNHHWRYPVTLTPAGSFYRLFSEKKLATGTYTAHLENKKREAFGSVSFRMEAYRIPQFEVQLHAPDKTPLDREFKTTLTATYYAGGRVANRPVSWRVTQFPYTWTPTAREGFVYSSDGRFSRTEKFESTPRLEKQGTTDAEGAAVLALNPAIEPTAQPRSYVVEATVTGTDDQTVTATRSILALPPFVLGLKAPRFLERATAIDAEVLVAGASGELLAGQEVTVRLLGRQWHSHLRAADFSEGTARYVTDIVDEKISEQKIRSAAEPIRLSLPLPRSGVYVVEIEARDRLGRAQTVAVDLYAGGAEPVAWEKPVTRVFTAEPDRDAYDPGSTAAILLKSPFQHAQALAVVEAPEGNEYRWVAVEGGAATFHVPIRSTYVPRLPVHFLLIRGRVPGAAPAGTRADLRKPATFAATAWLTVRPVDNRVEVKLASPEKARPGEKISVGIRLADPKGTPLPGEVTLWLVDQAVLALGREQRLDPIPDFVTAVRSRLTLRDTRELVFGALAFAENPGGEERAKASAASLLDRATVRKNFKTVPYYNPAIAVGPDGAATVSIDLPDNLTNFKIRAKAASGAQRFGSAAGEIAVRLPVIAQPALPRFVRPGDRLVVSAIGRVVEGGGGPGSGEIRAEGVRIGEPPRRTFTWTPGKPERLDFRADVPNPPFTKEGTLAYDAATIRVAVERDSDHASDAFEVRLPIRDDRDRVTRRVVAAVSPGAPVALPPVSEAARPGTIRRSILVSNQPGIVSMAGGLDFLLGYPYGCTEQRISVARSEIAMKAFRALLHADGSGDELDRRVRETIEWIGSATDALGLVGFWPGDPGTVSLTAWSLQFLTEARKAGFAVDAKLEETLVRTLDQALRSDYSRFVDGEAYAERAWALAALAGAGKSNPAYAAELARKARNLDLEAAAQVLKAFTVSEPSSPAVAEISSRLWEGLVFRLHQGKETYGGLQEKPVRNPLVLPSETRTLAEVTRALAASGTGNPRLPLLVDALVTLGRGNGWGTTNANSAALLALSERLKPSGAGAAAGTVRVHLGGETRDVSVSATSPVGWLVSESAADISVEAPPAVAAEWPSSSPLVVRAETSFVPQADGSRVAPEAQGFVVRREILRVRADGAPADRVVLSEPGSTVSLAVGDVIEEHVQIVNPEERHFVAVSAPLAAGVEPLNPRLATAPPEAAPAGRLTRAPSYAEYLDDRVSFYYDTLPKGTYDFYYRTRATVAGSFTQPAARAEMMYDGAVRGNSAGARIEIERPPGTP